MSRRINLPPCSAGPWFAGEPRSLRLKIPELESLDGFELVFVLSRAAGDRTLTRADGLRGVPEEGGAVMIVPFPAAFSEGLKGVFSYRAQVQSDEGPVTVAYGSLSIDA